MTDMKTDSAQTPSSAALLASMPDDARVWVFGAASTITGSKAEMLLNDVERFLESWKAHGTPLSSAAAWQHNQFLVIAVDEAATGASGCSIDGLFRILTALETHIDVRLTDSSRVFWRQSEHTIASGTRAEFSAAVRAELVHVDTPVFDTTVNTVGAWRAHFERPMHSSWHGRLARR